jgi:alpha-L-rhamnosidase
LRQDGWLELCAPARIGLTIPIFSFAWISAIHDYYLHSGRLDLYNYFSGQLKSMMSRYSELYDECSGLYRLPSGDDLWHFYEWVDGLNRTDTAACPITGAPQEMHSLFNLYWLETLNAYAGLCAADNADDAQHYNRIAEKLKSAIHRGFFNEKRHGYASFTNNDGQFGWHLHTQILALRNGVVPDDCLQALIDNIINGDFIRITYSAMPYLVQAMMPCSQDARVYVANLINKNYSIPVFQGATSMWETDQGSAAFSGAGSLCHGWSSLPAYYYRAWVLGVRPLSPGYCTFSISPCCGSFQSACGEIMTPSGVIRVQWTRQENGISLELNGPQNLTPVYLELPEVKVATIIWNGKNIKNPRRASPRNSRDREPEIQKTLELNQ